MQIGELQGENGRTNGIKAVNEIIDKRLLATPQNYEVWLNYQNNWLPSLTGDVDELISHGRMLDERTLEELYNKHFRQGGFDSTVIETGEQLSMQLASTLETLKSAGAITSEYSSELDQADKILKSGSFDQTSLVQLVQSLANATKKVSCENNKLTDQLSSSAQEIETLRVHLDSVRTASLTDMLTGLPNRRMFDETLQQRMKEAEHHGYALSLAICDVDHFKKFNDTWGHQTGDQVLRFVSSVLSSLSLDDQLVARYGGEEFAIVIPRLNSQESFTILDRMRKSIEAKQLKRKSTNDSLGNVTISIGVATLEKDEAGSSLISRADEMLYASKNAGRNRVTLWDGEAKKAVA